jgi:peptide/nickel transport system substrate-binding protein
MRMNQIGDNSLNRRSVLKAIALAGGVITIPGLLAACTGSTASSSKAVLTAGGHPIKTLTVGLPSSISSLDITHEAGIVNYVVALLCQEALVGVSASGALVPTVAQTWKQTDSRTFVYQIRPGVKFSDGSALTVDDVIASIKFNSTPGSTSALAYAYSGVQSVTATGPSEVTIKLKAPNSQFAWVVSPGTLVITSAAFLAKNGNKIGTPGVGILGSGPYKVTEFAPDSHVTLTRNEHWWGQPGEVENLRLEFIADDTTRLLAMRQKSVQMAMNVPLDQIDQWRQLDQVTVDVATDNSLVTLAFNTTKKPWDDANVRKAVAHAVDRAGIVRSILRGHAEVALTFPTKSEWGGLLSPTQTNQLYVSIPQYEFDLTKARAALAASSVPSGFSDTITYPNSGAQIGKALLTLSQNLKQIGINLAVKEITLEQWIADLGKHQSGIYLGWYFATTGDPAEYAQQLLNGAYVGVNGTNIANYSNPAVTASLDSAQTSNDSSQRAKLIGDALVKAAADVPYQPLWWGQAATAFGPKIAASGYGPYFFIGPWATSISAIA